MKKLGARNYTLLVQGIKITGSYKEAYFYAEEQLYIKQASTIYNFLCWVEEDKVNRGFGHGNYEVRFKQWLDEVKADQKKEYVPKAIENALNNLFK